MLTWWAESGELRLDHVGELFEAVRDKGGPVKGYLWHGHVTRTEPPIGHREDFLRLAAEWRDQERASRFERAERKAEYDESRLP